MLDEKPRFTLDGSAELETFLAKLCDRVSQGVQALVPASCLEGLVLAGGYGRGQGGVLQTATGDRPYNDLEFYVFIRGPRVLNQRRFEPGLELLGNQLSPQVGLHVEFKVDSLSSLRHGAVTMFSYDLVSRHRVVLGDETLFRGCEHHLNSRVIPPSEATRLLFNRCTGLLLAKERLMKSKRTDEDMDFITRNVAKAQLALGDALLAGFGEYHWSCLERHQRLQRFSCAPTPPKLAVLRSHHRAGIHFKLHPRKELPSNDLESLHRELCSLALEEWLWLESRRLERPFSSIRDYALSQIRKCPETAWWRNLLLTAKTFGPKALFAHWSRRYPRERLLSTLPLFLTGEIASDPELVRHAQRQLHTKAADLAGLLTAYKRLWSGYG